MAPSEFQQKVWHNAITAISITVIGGLLVGGIWLLGEVLAYLQPVLVPLAVAGIFAYLLDPIVNWCEKVGLSRLKAIIVVFIALAVSIGVFSTMIAVPLNEQVRRLNNNKDSYVENAREMLEQVGKIDGLVEALPAPMQKLFPQNQSGSKDEGLASPAAMPGGGDEVPERKAVTPQEAAPVAPAVNTSDDGGATDEVVTPSLTEAYREYVEGEGVKEGEPVTPVADDTTSPVDGEEQAVNGFNWSDLLSFDTIMESLKAQAPELAKRVASAITRGASRFFGIIGYALGFIMVPVYLFFFLKESVVIQKNWRRFIPLRASKFKDEVVEVVAEINSYLIAFFRGQVLVSVIDGFLVGLVLKFFGHPYAILLGIALAVLGIIPFIGNIICLIPAAVTAYAHFSLESEQYWIGSNPWTYVALVLGIFIVVQQINSLVTAPKIVGDSVGLHPMTVIFSMLFWSLLLGGFLGALLAVPLTASVKVLFRRYIWERQKLQVSEDGEPLAVTTVEAT